MIEFTISQQPKNNITSHVRSSWVQPMLDFQTNNMQKTTEEHPSINLTNESINIKKKRNRVLLGLKFQIDTS